MTSKVLETIKKSLDVCKSDPSLILAAIWFSLRQWIQQTFRFPFPVPSSGPGGVITEKTKFLELTLMELVDSAPFVISAILLKEELPRAKNEPRLIYSNQKTALKWESGHIET